jgi:hypothetical protein
MGSVIGDNWIQTRAHSSCRTSWTVVRSGREVQSGEVIDDDPSAFRAHQLGLAWAQSQFPAVAFHWRHQSLALTLRRELTISQLGLARMSRVAGMKK